MTKAALKLVAPATETQGKKRKARTYKLGKIALLKRYKRVFNKTNQQLAEDFGVSVSAIGNWFARKRFPAAQAALAKSKLREHRKSGKTSTGMRGVKAPRVTGGSGGRPYLVRLNENSPLLTIMDQMGVKYATV